MYCLIVSQYYYSRHCYIVEYDPDSFLYSARGLIEELEVYKRTKELQAFAIYYGDLSKEHYTPGRQRYNVNDIGDIYFLIKSTANGLLYDFREFQMASYKESRGYQRKNVEQRVSENHDWCTVSDIVSKYFVLA